MNECTENGRKLIEFVSEKFQKNELTNDDLVQLIECAGMYLNLMTIPDYSAKWKISYNGVKKFRVVMEIFNVKFVIDNE